jgi:hypothetical protein
VQQEAVDTGPGRDLTVIWYAPATGSVNLPVDSNQWDTADMDPSRETRDLLRGWPGTTHSPFTPAGEIEQAAKIAEGLRSPRQGWRRVVARIGFCVVILAAAVLVVLLVRAQLG